MIEREPGTNHKVAVENLKKVIERALGGSKHLFIKKSPLFVPQVYLSLGMVPNEKPVIISCAINKSGNLILGRNNVLPCWNQCE